MQVMLHAAHAVRSGGPQLEILMRVRHARQPLFGFLQPEDARHAFFRWLTRLAEADAVVEALHEAQAVEPCPKPSPSALAVMQRLAASVQASVCAGHGTVTLARVGVQVPGPRWSNSAMGPRGADACACRAPTACSWEVEGRPHKQSQTPPRLSSC